MTKPAAYVETCKVCSHENEMPFVFCRQCGAPRRKLGRFRVTMNLSVAFAALMGSYYLKDLLDWNWPFYILFALFLTQFSASLVRGVGSLVLKFHAWFVVFLATFFALFYFMRRGELEIAVYWLRDVPDIAATEPLLFFSVLATLVVGAALLLYVRWGRIYGWVIAYRLVLLTFLFISGGAVGAMALAQHLHDTEAFAFMTTPSVTEFLAGKRVYEKDLTLLSVSLLRLFCFEIVVFAAVKGYAEARARYTFTRPAGLERETGFTRSLFSIAQMTHRLVLAMENMLRYLVSTLLILLRDLGKVCAAFASQLLIPSVALSVCGVMCYKLTLYATAYIATNSLASFLAMAACVGVLIGASMCFLACKSPFRFGRILAFHVDLIGWLVPNLLVFFLLLSFSLYFTSRAVNNFSEGEHDLPFRIGILTRIALILVAALVAVIIYRKRSIFLAGNAVAVEAASAPPAPAPAEVPDAVTTSRPGQSEGNKRKLTIPPGKLIQSLDKGAGALKESSRGVMEYLKGKPDIIDKLARAEASYQERVSQLQALENVTDSISVDTRQRLQQQYETDIAALKDVHKRMKEEFDRQHADYLKAGSTLEEDLRMLRDRKDELDRLFEAGAVGRDDFKKQDKELRSKISVASARLQQCETMSAYFSSSPRVSP